MASLFWFSSLLCAFWYRCLSEVHSSIGSPFHLGQSHPFRTEDSARVPSARLFSHTALPPGMFEANSLPGNYCPAFPFSCPLTNLASLPGLEIPLDIQHRYLASFLPKPLLALLTNQTFKQEFWKKTHSYYLYLHLYPNNLLSQLYFENVYFIPHPSLPTA